jgi:tripartite-type tricarboxylate transporter receptor subunit TctC
MMSFGRRLILTMAAGSALPAPPVMAQEDFPSRTIRLIVPRAPGGGSDTIARLLAPSLGARLGQTIVVENKPDATAIIGAEFVARSRPDGYTLYLSDNSFYFNPSILPSIPYDTIRDFSAVTMLAEGPVILILHPSVPATTLAELVAHAKANPGRLAYASGGVGSSTHFAGVLFNLRAGTEMTHVAYRSSGPALSALLAGQVQMQFGGLSSAKPLLEAGEVRALALTGARREPSMPTVPTFTEAGVAGVDVTSVWGIHAPAGTPLPIRRKLRDAIAASMQEPELNARLRSMAYSPTLNTPEEHQAQTNHIVQLWLDISKQVNLRD